MARTKHESVSKSGHAVLVVTLILVLQMHGWFMFIGTYLSCQVIFAGVSLVHLAYIGASLVRVMPWAFSSPRQLLGGALGPLIPLGLRHICAQRGT